MNRLRWLLILAVFAGMIALSVILWPYGGAGGIIGGGVGFLLRLWGRGLDASERIGNGFVGALMGMPLGLLAGGLYAIAWPYLLNAYNSL
ncbi:hypothetical protein [Terricaulis sp.]|uniref:hypothetical protein n=1 Tax=Terricaulis sp. TaxID=2768686 RepID=UPI0037847AE2